MFTKYKPMFSICQIKRIQNTIFLPFFTEIPQNLKNFQEIKNGGQEILSPPAI
jgi:hypothetical protein